MKTIMSLSTLFLMAALSANAAQLYRWVDSKGNVEWRDTPPPSTAAAKQIEQRKMGDNVIGTDEVPYSVQLAAKNHPVTLWINDCGPACNNARAHLNRRGVPYTERNPQSDFDAFRKVSPDANLPLLQVGTTRVTGYLESEWDNTLDYAGYPRTAPIVRAKPPAKPAADAAKPLADGAPAVTGAPAAPPAPAAK